MNEYVEAVRRLNEQLAHAGVPATLAQTTLIAYIAALQHRSKQAWRTFYFCVYARLKELAERPLPFVGGPAEPLLALLEDDMGVTLIGIEERERIRASLVEYRRSEASLSS